MRSRRIGLASVLSLVATAALSCQSPAPTPPEEPPVGGGTGGNAPPGGSGGSPGTSGGSSGSAGGAGGGSSTGTGGSSSGTGGGAGTAGSAGGGGSGQAGSGGSSGNGGSGGGTPPAGTPDGGAPVAVDGPPASPPSPPQGQCDYTPKANAAEIRLRFEQIQLTGVPTSDNAKGNGSRDGVTEIRFIPGKEGELLLLQKGGRLSHLRLASADATTAMLVKSYEIPGGVNVTEDCGAISLAFDPEFATNKLIYIGHCSGPRASKISRLTWDGNTLSDRVDIMTWDGAGGAHAWHTIGSIGFDAAGSMWVVHGEFTNGNQAQNGNTNLGKLLRLIPNRQPGQGDYTVPADNPFAMAPKPRSAIYAVGLRSPWRANLDAKGRWIIGDVGDTTNEELNVVTAKEQNFGWNGNTSGPCSGMCRAPLSYWRRVRNDCADDYCGGDGNEVRESRGSRVVWVGAQYGNCGTDRYNGALTGVQLFGDFFAGWVRGLVLDDTGNRAAKDANLAYHGGITTMAQGSDGYLYVGTLGPYDAATTERPGLWRIRPAQ